MESTHSDLWTTQSEFFYNRAGVPCWKEDIEINQHCGRYNMKGVGYSDGWCGPDAECEDCCYCERMHHPPRILRFKKL
jgi:hypothetical protein